MSMDDTKVLHAGKRFLLYLTTGPPTWPFPRLYLEVGKASRAVTTGWLRLAVTLQWQTGYPRVHWKEVVAQAESEGDQ